MMHQDDKKNDTNDFSEQTIQPADVSATAAQEAMYKDQFLRVSSDFANYKRRAEKERADVIIMAQGTILEKLLPIFDELDRALTLIQQSPASTDSSWINGLLLIQKNWQKLFNELEIEEIPTTGIFDPQLHEGLTQVEDTTKESGAIAQTFSKGYRFKGKVLRHAKVSVVK